MPKQKAWKRLLKAMYKHPYITVGSVAVPVAVAKAVTGVADKIHSTYDIASQHSQKKILEKQLKALSEIASNTKTEHQKKTPYEYQQPESASYYIPKKLYRKEKRYF